MQVRSLLRACIARLPRPLRRVVDSIYARYRRISPEWLYNADGIATIHRSPFLEDAEWSRLYDRMAADWFQDHVIDVRWRMWLLTRYALHARNLPGNYAEFGVYRGGCSWMVLATAGLERTRRMHLFDTFEGIPEDNLTEDELDAELGGRLSDTSVDYVARLLKPWDPIPQLWPGDVFETIPATDTDALAFVHLDLNAAAPTRHVLEHVYDRIVPGGIVVFDDYGFHGYEDQHRMVDEFLVGRPEVLVSLPTGQAVLTKVA